jgi:hypothetical protein
VEIHTEHDESQHLKIIPYKSTEENTRCFDFNDSTTWPNVNNRITYCLIKHGTDQGLDTGFCTSVPEDRRQFSYNWFSKKLPNEEHTKCNWLIYSNISCFCYILFRKIFQGKQMSHLANQKRGFSQLKHLYRLEKHENSP